MTELIHRLDGQSDMESNIIKRVHAKLQHKASRSDLNRIASVANKLSSTVQVLHEAHRIEDPMASLSSAATKCLTCNRSVVSVQSDATTKLSPNQRQSARQSIQQSKLMPIHLQNRRRPQTSTSASKRRRQWSGSTPTTSKMRPSSSSINMTTSAVHSNESLGGQQYDQMEPLFNYVKGCNGHLFRASKK